MPRRAELRLPEFLNGAEERGLHLRSGYIDSATETVRRMQDLYQCISAGKYNLLCASHRSYSNLARQTRFGNNYIRSIYLNNALHWYNSAFDLLLQVVWFHYRLYDEASKGLALSVNFEKALKQCSADKIKEQIEIVPTEIIDAITDLKNRYTECREWTNNLKHRRFIRYSELASKGKPAVITAIPVEGESLWDAFRQGRIAYNSMETELMLSMKKVKSTLVYCHKAIYNAAAIIVETIGYWPDRTKKQLYHFSRGIQERVLNS